MGAYVQGSDGQVRWDESKADPSDSGGSLLNGSGQVIGSNAGVLSGATSAGVGSAPTPNQAAAGGGGGTEDYTDSQHAAAQDANQAAAVAADRAYHEWLARSGDDRLAFEKAKEAAFEAYQTASLGLEALKTAASLQSNPFRQQQYLYGLGNNPYLSGAVGAIAGKYSLPAFQAPQTGSVAGSASLGDLASRIGGTGGGGTPADFQAALDAFPNPNQVVAREYVRLDPSTKNYVLSGLAAKTGLDVGTLDSQIKATLPQFKSPSFGSVAI